MPGLSTLLDSAGDAGRQLFLWGVLVGIVNQVTQPYQRDLAYLVNTKDPNVKLSPADLADLVVRGIRDKTDAAAEAQASGVNKTRFIELVHDAGEPPGLETVLQMLRRGIIRWGDVGPTKPTAANAIATSRIYTYWSDAIRASQIVPIPPAEAVDALVEGQITKGTRDNVAAAANGETVDGLTAAATTFYEIMWASGITPDQADVMFNTRGNPPSPTELFELYRRGLIPQTGTGPDVLSVQQGIYEGALKDKWWPVIANLETALPAVYYIRTALKTGAITRPLATKLLTESGYTPTFVAAIVGTGTAAQVADYAKLTESLILKVYADKVVSRTQAKQLLADIGYGTEAATFVLTAADLTKSAKAIDSAVTRVANLFLARKIDTATAISALGALDITNTAANTLVQTWTLERNLTVKILTEAQITDAYKYSIITQTQALAELQAIGYTPYDAWVVLSIKAEQALPGMPAPGPGPTGNVA